MDAVSIIALSMGAAWASGINLYAAVFMLGYMGTTGHIVLPLELQVLSDPLVMTAAAVMYCKAGSRLLINTSPEPFSNWGASITEDLLVIAGLWTALTHPLWFLAALIIFILIMIWLLPRLWHLIKTVLRYIGSWLGWCEKPEKANAPSTGTIVVKSVTDKTES